MKTNTKRIPGSHTSGRRPLTILLIMTTISLLALACETDARFREAEDLSGDAGMQRSEGGAEQQQENGSTDERKVGPSDDGLSEGCLEEFGVYEPICLTWVGQLKVKKPCPAAGAGWTGRKLFGDDAPGVLGLMCIYEADGTTDPELCQLPWAGNRAPWNWLDPDCNAVGGM